MSLYFVRIFRRVCQCLLLALAVHTPAFAQTQPKVMVIPYTTASDDIRTLLEVDENKRLVITKIKEAFDKRGVSTIDFTAKLKSIESGNVFNSNNQQDIKTQIIDMSGADVYVEAEILCQESTTGNQVKVILTAYESATGTSLSNAIGESDKFYTDDYGKLGMRAIEKCADDFLSTLQDKFANIEETGKSIMIQIGFDEGSQYSMKTEIGGQGYELQDEIELWIDEHCFEHNYHLQGVSAKKMIVDDVRIPSTMTASKWSIEFGRFFRNLNLDVTRDFKGNTLYISIQ